MSIEANHVPPWKHALLERKRRQEEEEKRKSEIENARIAHIPAWKREILSKKQQQRNSQVYIANNEGYHQHASKLKLLPPGRAVECDATLFDASIDNKIDQSNVENFKEHSINPNEHILPINKNPLLKTDLELKRNSSNFYDSLPNNHNTSLISSNSNDDTIESIDETDVFNNDDSGEFKYGRGFVNKLLQKFQHLSKNESNAQAIPEGIYKRSQSTDSIICDLNGSLRHSQNYNLSPNQLSSQPLPSRSISVESLTSFPGLQPNKNDFTTNIDKLEENVDQTLDSLYPPRPEPLGREFPSTEPISDQSNLHHNDHTEIIKGQNKDEIIIEELPRPNTVSSFRNIFEGSSKGSSQKRKAPAPPKFKDPVQKPETKKNDQIEYKTMNFNQPSLPSNGNFQLGLQDGIAVKSQDEPIKDINSANPTLNSYQYSHSENNSRHSNLNATNNNFGNLPIKFSDSSETSLEKLKPNLNEANSEVNIDTIENVKKGISRNDDKSSFSKKRRAPSIPISPVKDVKNTVSENLFSNLSDSNLKKKDEYNIDNSPTLTSDAGNITTPENLDQLNKNVPNDNEIKESHQSVIEPQKNFDNNLSTLNLKSDLNSFTNTKSNEKRLNLSLDLNDQKNVKSSRMNNIINSNSTKDSKDTTFKNNVSLTAKNTIVNKHGRIKHDPPKGPGILLIRPASNLVPSNQHTNSQYLELTRQSNTESSTDDNSETTSLSSLTGPNVTDINTIPMPYIDDDASSENALDISSTSTNVNEKLVTTNNLVSDKYNFIGQCVSTGRSLLAKTRTKKLCISFADLLVDTFEYPSEQSVISEYPPEPTSDGKPSDEGEGDEADLPLLQNNTSPQLKSTPGSLPGGGLSSYRSRYHVDYDFSDEKEKDHSPAPLKRPEPEIYEGEAEEQHIKPADEEDFTWSNATSSDMLF